MLNIRTAFHLYGLSSVQHLEQPNAHTCLVTLLGNIFQIWDPQSPNPPSMSPILSVLHDLYSASYSYSARYQWSLLSFYCLWWYIWSLLHVPDLPYIHKIMFSVFYSPFAFPSLQIFRMLNWAEDRGDHLAPANIGGHSKLIRLRTLQSGVSSFEMHLYWHPIQIGDSF